MQILRLLAARRAALTLTSAASERGDTGDDDEGPFFDLDFSSCSVRASSSTSSGSDSDSDESCDFIISLQRTASASLFFSRSGATPLKFCASEPPAPARTTSFAGARKAASVYGGGRDSFARSSCSSGRSLPLFLDSPPRATEHAEHKAAEKRCKRAPSRDVIRRCLAKISRRLRKRARGLHHLRKCRSASSTTPRPRSATARGDDSVAEKQDGITGAIAHCKESLHRASTSEPDSKLQRPRSDPGKCEAA